MKVVTYPQIRKYLALLIPNSEIKPVKELNPKWEGVYIKSEDVEYVLYVNTANTQQLMTNESVFIIDIYENGLDTKPTDFQVFPHLGRALCYLSSK